MSEALDVRRRRAGFRAGHRGTKEMDWLLGRYADAHLTVMDDPRLALFEKLLSVPDPEIHAWILQPDILGTSEFSPLIDDMRKFHGLKEDRV